jgi:hypothetical protein
VISRSDSTSSIDCGSRFRIVFHDLVPMVRGLLVVIEVDPVRPVFRREAAQLLRLVGVGFLQEGDEVPRFGQRLGRALRGEDKVIRRRQSLSKDCLNIAYAGRAGALVDEGDYVLCGLLGHSAGCVLHDVVPQSSA